MKESAEDQKLRLERMSQVDKTIRTLVDLNETEAAYQLRVISDHHLRTWEPTR